MIALSGSNHVLALVWITDRNYAEDVALITDNARTWRPVFADSGPNSAYIFGTKEDWKITNLQSTVYTCRLQQTYE